MQGIAEQESRNPDQHLTNFAEWYRHLRQEMDQQEYIKDLSEVIEGFITMRLEGAGGGAPRNQSQNVGFRERDAAQTRQ